MSDAADKALNAAWLIYKIRRSGGFVGEDQVREVLALIRRVAETLELEREQGDVVNEAQIIQMMLLLERIAIALEKGAGIKTK